MEKTTSFLKRQPTEEEYKRGKLEAIVLGFIIGWIATSLIEYLFNINIPAIIKYFVIIGGFTFLSQKFLSKHLGKKITFRKQAQEHNEELDQKVIEIKKIDDKQSKKGLILSIVIVIIIIFIVAIFSQLSDDKNIKFAQTDKSDSYSERDGNLYRNTKYDFRIKFPEGWDIKTGDGLNILQKAVSGNHTISVGVHEIPAEYSDKTATIKNIMSLAEFKDGILKDMQNKSPDTRLIDYGETKLDNEPAYWIKYSTPYTTLDVTVNVTQLQYQIFNNNIIYFIAAGSLSEEFQSVEVEFMKSISTFVIEDY